MSAVEAPLSLAISPGWGVRTIGDCRLARMVVSDAIRFSPSASMTMGTRLSRTNRPTSRPVDRWVPVPGPMARQRLSLSREAMVSQAVSSNAPSAVSGKPTVMASVTMVSSWGFSDFGMPTVTNPAPARMAAAAAMAAAPVFPGEPARTSRCPV